jgi:hypothetical protein
VGLAAAAAILWTIQRYLSALPAAAAAQLVTTEVPADALDPEVEGGGSSKLCQLLIDPHEGLLNDVFSGLLVSEEEVTQSPNPIQVKLVESFPCPLIPVEYPGYQT